MMDRTQTAVRRQLNALDAHEYEVGIRDPEKGMIRRTWTALKILKALGWLKYCNANGAHIYIRPRGTKGYVLVDDLTQGAISQMRKDGFMPAVVVETSPDNFQCWLRLVAHHQGCDYPHELITKAARKVALDYGGDLASADWRHFGRMVGFTNRKPEYRRDGRYPFVFLRGTSGQVCTQGYRLLKHVSLILDKDQEKAHIRHSMPFSVNPLHRPSLDYRACRRWLLGHYSGAAWRDSPDLSRLDFMIAKVLLAAGYKPSLVRDCLRDSPCLSDRKLGHIEDYLSRTLTAAQSARGSFLPPPY